MTFKKLDIETNEIHGSFNKDTGVFTVKTDGIYLVQFNGVVFGDKKFVSQIDLRVNEIAAANSHYCS